MEEGRSNRATSADETSVHAIAWGQPICVVVCDNCEARFITFASNTAPSTCPNCFQGKLSCIEGSTADSAFGQVEPEIVEPFRVSQESLERASKTFAKGIPLPPEDLNHANLVKRLRRVYLPAWLVDATAEARWWGEAGFDYDVVSHVDTYDENGGGWHSQQITETRTRWEPRLGTLNHTFSNLLLPALEERQDLTGRVYRPDPTEAIPYSPSAMGSTIVRLPERAQGDVWTQATPQLQQLAAALCRQATGADHLRLFQWQAQYPRLNWTLLLSPLYTSFYLDDDGTPQPVFFRGASGVVIGQRRASMLRAKHLATILAGIGAGLFALGLILVLAGYLTTGPLLPIGGIVAIAGMFLAMTALAPLLVVWHFNRQQLKGSHSVVRPPSIQTESIHN